MAVPETQALAVKPGEEAGGFSTTVTNTTNYYYNHFIFFDGAAHCNAS